MLLPAAARRECARPTPDPWWDQLNGCNHCSCHAIVRSLSSVESGVSSLLPGHLPNTPFSLGPWVFHNVHTDSHNRVGKQKTYHFAMESLRIVPVCDRHIAAKPMHPATVPFTSADKFFKCWEIGCERYYSPSQGYFFLRSERVQKGTRAMKECPSPSCTRAYLGIVRSEGAHRWWRCFDCGSMVENPAPWRSL